MLKTLVTFSIALQSLILYSQKLPKFGEVSLDELKMTDYPGDTTASAVILFDKGECYLDDQLSVTFKRHIRIKFFKKDAFDKWANETIYLNHLSESISKLKGATYNLEGEKIVTSEMAETSVFKSKFDKYLDQVKFALANVREGSVIEYSYTLSTAVSLLPGWQFQYTIPSIWSEYEASISNSFTFEQEMQGKLQVANYEAKNNKYRWVMTNVPAFKEEPYMTTVDDYVSKIAFNLTEIFIPGRPLIDLKTSWWKICNELLDDTSFGGAIKGSGYLKKNVEETTTGIDDPMKKIQAIYSFVKKNVEWNEMIDRIPDHSFKKVLEDKKGSSSEINLLLVSMLQKAGLQADPVLISTRSHGRIKGAPAFDQFNDVICRVLVGDKNILLDATDKHLSMASLPNRCLNGKGLIVSKELTEWIPITTTKARTVVNADFRISEEGELEGRLNIARDGHDGAIMRKSFVDLGQDKYLTESFDGKSWEIGKSSFVDVENTDESVKEIHDLVIRDHAQTAGDLIYINPYVMGRMEENPLKSETREYPVDFASAFDKFYVMKILVPESYTVEELPKPKMIAIPNNGGKFLYSATQTGNTINFVSQLAINRNIFQVEEYPYLRELYNQMIAKQSEQIVLKRK